MTRAVRFDDFSGGEWGQKGARQAARNQFSAKNMLVYRDGSVGPRAGLEAAAVTGLPNGLVWGLAATPVAGADLIVVVGAQPYKVNSAGGGAAAAYSAALAATPTKPMDFVRLGTDVYGVSYADKAYKFVATGPTLTALAASPGGRAVAVLGQRLIVANTTVQGERLHYSAAGDFTSWPAANYIDVDDDWPITGLWAQRGHLLISKQTGFYTHTGTPGGSDSAVRKIATRPGPLWPPGQALLGNDWLAYVPVNGHFPAMFNGAVGEFLRNLPVNSAEPYLEDGRLPDYTVRPIQEDGCIVLDSAASKAMVLLNGVWTFHDFEASVPLVAGDGDRLVFCDGGAAGAAGVVYNWLPDSNAPGREASTWERAGDGSSTPFDAYLHLPEWWTDRDEEVRVRSVVVEFASWATGSGSTNHFDLTVRAVGRRDAAVSKDSTVLSFDEAAATSSSSGTVRQKVFLVGDQGDGRGFQVRFANVRGCSIRSVTAHLEPAAGRRGT